ncbi:MAG: UDP-glucose/GDP-mannose dehydrogenase family protein [Anaplasmataceae bacterium]|nr:UDP-glucose/GDP-mannose dehydrogenase family protein [Anaplasmataceae bacterium]
MNILVIGAGYVGLVTAACMAEMGHCVLCIDIDPDKISNLSQGIIPIYEPGLEELIDRNTEAGRLSFSTTYPDSTLHMQVCFIAVATPESSDGSCNLQFVLDVAKSLGQCIHRYQLVVIKSTVPVGTSAKVRASIESELKKRNLFIPIDIVSNPEFLKEGSAVADCMKPDRVIIGAETPKAIEMMRELYAPFTMNHDRMIIMDIKSAEMTKYAANAMLATRISFMNELANLCEKLGANINDVRIGIGSDARIGYQFLYAGAGYGGSCFPKDLRALQAMAHQAQTSCHLIDAVEKINHEQKKRLAEKLKRYFATRGGLNNKTIAIWGLSFKPNTDDMREAPSLELIRELLQEGATLRLFDPVAQDNAKKLFPTNDRLLFCNDEYDAADGSHAIALITEWKQFRFVDLSKIQLSMKGQGFFDGRNQYKSTDMRGKGFDYHAIGIPVEH